MIVKQGFDFLGDLWGKKQPEPPLKGKSFDDLWESEWSPEFERLMRNRLVMGAFRYGLLNDPRKPQFDRMNSLRKRVEGYEKTGNLEFLVDAANMLLLEFEEGNHPNKHFSSIDDGEHTQIRSNPGPKH